MIFTFSTKRFSRPIEKPFARTYVPSIQAPISTRDLFSGGMIIKVQNVTTCSPCTR